MKILLSVILSTTFLWAQPLAKRKINVDSLASFTPSSVVTVADSLTVTGVVTFGTYTGQSSIVTVGGLSSGSIAAGFTAIDTARTNAVSNVLSNNTFLTVATSGKTKFLTVDTSKYATTSVSGFLKAADWYLFNSKESPLTFNSPLSRSVNAVSFLPAAGSAWDSTRLYFMGKTNAGALDLGTNTITSGLINGQTISSAANFTGTVAITGNTTVTGILNQLGKGTGSNITTIGDATGANDAQLRLRPNTGEYGWSLGASTLVGNALTLTPSTAVAGATFTTPTLIMQQTGALTLGSAAGTGVGAFYAGAGTFTGTLGVTGATTLSNTFTNTFSGNNAIVVKTAAATGTQFQIGTTALSGTLFILNYSTGVGDLDFVRSDGTTSIFKLVEATKAATFTGTLGVTGDVTATADVAINGGDLTTTVTTFNLLNATATTVNAFGAATTVGIGAGTGTTTVNNALSVMAKFQVNTSGEITKVGSFTGDQLGVPLVVDTAYVDSVNISNGAGASGTFANVTAGKMYQISVYTFTLTGGAGPYTAGITYDNGRSNTRTIATPVINGAMGIDGNVVGAFYSASSTITWQAFGSPASSGPVRAFWVLKQLTK